MRRIVLDLLPDGWPLNFAETVATGSLAVGAAALLVTFLMYRLMKRSRIGRD